MALLTAKTLAIAFALATTAFCVATIVLAVQKAELEDDLQDALDKLDTISTMATPTTSSTTTSTAATPVDPNPTAGPEEPDPTPDGAENSTVTTPPTGVPGPDPVFPTLPPGLPKPEEIVYRLPSEIRPIKYKLYIHPNLETHTCEGTVSIQIEIDVATNLVVLHARDLEIDSITILNMMGRMRIRIKQYNLDREREMLFIELEELLYTETPYVVSISYRCQLDGLSGAYASSYLVEGGKERAMRKLVK